MLDLLAMAEVLGGCEVEDVDWESLLPSAIDQQIENMVEGITAFNKHYWTNALPRPGYYEMEQRVEADVSVLMKIKKNNLFYSRLIQFMLNKCPHLKETFVLKHGLHRFMTGVGSHDRLGKKEEKKKKEDEKKEKKEKKVVKKKKGSLEKTDKGQYFRHLYLLFDYYVDTRKDSHSHPIRAWEKRLHENPIYFDLAKQQQDLGEDWKEPVYDCIGIKTPEEEELPRRYPRLYALDDTSPETGAQYLKFLSYKKVGEMSPKHTALYFADEAMEPFHHVLPPSQVKRNFMDRWIKNFYQMKFKESEHNCGRYGPIHAQKKMSCHLDTMKIRIVEAAGYDVKDNDIKIKLFELMTSFLDEIDHTVSGMPIESPWIWEDEEERHPNCFHRNPHACPGCCIQDPVQELFAARTTDDPRLVCYHPIHELS